MERCNGVDSSISSGGVNPTTIDPTTETPSKLTLASDINFAENSKKVNPTPNKGIIVPAPPNFQIISFIGYGDDAEDCH